jgi:predicted metal-binding membrane protein
MTDNTEHGFASLPPPAAALGAAFARPKIIAGGCIVALTLLGWAALALMSAGQGDVFAVLCGPSTMAFGTTDVSLVALMWAAMVLAMMLPSAAPMILTYAEIADTAARKREPVVTPFAIAAGYTVVWFGYAALATILQIALTRAALLNSGLTAASGLFAGAIFIAAGVYQFSALKHACLRQCQHPFPFFFANWATTPRGVFRLGVRQGLFCVGCCWAMMMVMLAVGTMNIIWMAGLAVVMTIEKIGVGRWFSHAVGIALILIGIGFVAAGFAAHWPGHAI